MNPRWWQDRWEAGETGWHVQGPNPWLVKHFGLLEACPGDTVFVPLCGKSDDLAWLRGQGATVAGVELSQKAVAEFHAERGIEASITKRGSMQVWESDSLAIHCGDFFDLAGEDLEPVRAVWDRAALIALTAEQRRRYARRLADWLAPGARLLLVTLDYPKHEMEGPPFSVPESEVCELFSAGFAIEPLGSEDALARHPEFQARGLSRLAEEGWLLSRS